MNFHAPVEQFRWTPESLETLRRLVDASHTSSFIAQALGTSRNSVIGKVRYLGLQLTGQRAYAKSSAEPTRRRLSWSPRVIERLREIAPRGLPSDQIAQILMREFGGHTTPNAIRAKASQLKISLRGSEAQRKEWRAKGASVQKQAAQKRRARKVNEAWAFKGEAQPVGVFLSDLKKEHCRFPMGDPREENFSFCGGPRVPSGPYCAAHHQLCYRRP